MEADKKTVQCSDCQQHVFEYETSLIHNASQGGSDTKVCADCLAKNWRICCLCDDEIRMTSYDPNNTGDFEVNAIWRDDELLEDGTYMDYMCHACCEKLMPALNFFIGADKEMLRKCRALCKD